MYRDQDKTFYDLKPEEILALVTWAEARGECADGQLAVMNVIRNRTIKRGWLLDSSLMSQGLSVYHAVILKNVYVDSIKQIVYQFSCFMDKDPNRPQMLIMAQEQKFPFLNMAERVIAGQEHDNTDGALFYANLSICNPSWAKTMKEVANIGHHTFFC